MNQLLAYLLLGVLPEAIIYTAFLVVASDIVCSVSRKAIMLGSIFGAMIISQKMLFNIFDKNISTLIFFISIWYIYELYLDHKPVQYRSMILVSILAMLHMTLDVITALIYGMEKLLSVFQNDISRYYLEVAFPERVAFLLIIMLVGPKVFNMYHKLLGNWGKYHV